MIRTTTWAIGTGVALLSASCEKTAETPTPVPVVSVPAPTAQPSAIVTLPDAYDGKSELAALVMLHGMGSKPTDFLGDEYGDLADSLKSVVVAVSGPVPEAEGKYDWSDDIEVNSARVNAGLAEARSKARVRKDRVVLMGYSQGAYAALGLAYAHPETFAGVIAISPGSLTNPVLPQNPSPLLAKRGFVLCYGGQDEADFIRQGKDRTEAARRAGAKIEVKEYPKAGHLIPQDRDEVFPRWFAFVVRANEE